MTEKERGIDMGPRIEALAMNSAHDARRSACPALLPLRRVISWGRPGPRRPCLCMAVISAARIARLACLFCLDIQCALRKFLTRFWFRIMLQLFQCYHRHFRVIQQQECSMKLMTKAILKKLPHKREVVDAVLAL